SVEHTTRIPHIPTSQARVERAHKTIKEYLAKQKKTTEDDPSSKLQQVLFTLTFLSLAEEAKQLPVVTHYSHV
ncbi:IGEB protein, partial [Malurus elegans]|nr:IGEB protein [Malurus elegans]